MRTFKAVLLFLVLAPGLLKAEPQQLEQIQMAEEDYQARQLMKYAGQLADEGKFEEALSVLDQAKGHVRSSKKLLKADEVSARHETRLIGKEKREGTLLREADKRQKFLEVDTYWMPPRPYDKEPFAEGEEASQSLPIEERARRRIPLIDFKDATLKEVVEFLARAANVNIVIDEKSLVQQERVTVFLKDIPMIEALDFILKTQKLGARIEENIILVTNPENLGEKLEVRVYDVQDLVGKLHDFPATPFDFNELTQGSGSGGGGKGDDAEQEEEAA